MQRSELGFDRLSHRRQVQSLGESADYELNKAANARIMDWTHYWGWMDIELGDALKGLNVK